jgi:hypothetical protein
MIIRETNREYAESLPFDFNSSPHLDGVTNILKILQKTTTYDLNLIEIMYKYNENELAIKEENMYLVHFFKDIDLIDNNEEYPKSIESLKKEKLEEVKNKFKKRFEKLYNILNDSNNIICFLRIENYDNSGWNYELNELTKILLEFKNPNKYLIYSQNLIDDNLHFNNSKSLNYDYGIPILFIKHFFYDLEMINNKDLFITILNTFEFLTSNENIIEIKHNNKIEKYFLDYNKLIIYKLTNINFFSQFYINTDGLFINNVMTGYDKYILNIDQVYEKELNNLDIK